MLTAMAVCFPCSFPPQDQYRYQFDHETYHEYHHEDGCRSTCSKFSHFPHACHEDLEEYFSNNSTVNADSVTAKMGMESQAMISIQTSPSPNLLNIREEETDSLVRGKEIAMIQMME